MKHIYTVIILSLSIWLSACSGEEDAARIVIGDSNALFSLNELQYQNPYVVQVTDIDGNPAPNTSVSISVSSTAYRTGSYSSTASGWVQQVTKECVAEDKNNNARLDAGEDVNASGALEPTNASTVAAHPNLTPTLTAGSNIIITDESGFGYFSLTYPKSEAVWSWYKITASARVSGTEGDTYLEGILPVVAEDLEDITLSPPGGVTSAYGLDSNCEIYVP